RDFHVTGVQTCTLPISAYGTGPLLGIAAGAIAVLLFLVMKVRLHAFVSLTLVSLLVALATRIPAADVMPTLLDGFGSTLANVARSEERRVGQERRAACA